MFQICVVLREPSSCTPESVHQQKGKIASPDYQVISELYERLAVRADISERRGNSQQLVTF